MAAHANVHLHDLQADDVTFKTTDGGTRWIDAGPVTFFLPYNDDDAQALLVAFAAKVAEALRSYNLTRGQVAALLEGTGLTVGLRSTAPRTADEILGIRELVDPELV